MYVPRGRPIWAPFKLQDWTTGGPGLQRHQQSDGTQRETEHLSPPVWQIPGARSSLPRYSIECYRLGLMPASSL